jgi:hypothetical protein
MYRRIVGFVFVCLCAAQTMLHAQDFKLFDRDVQIHGFATQGFVHTNENNWLTMETTNVGSGEFSDFGANASTQITDNLRIGAQFYDRNLGGIGKWYPTLDWAYAQYKFKSWFGIRGGRVKTVLGLYNDTQDLDFLHPFALLPQSMYSIDVRDSTIAHDGGDLFGDIRLGSKYGSLSYTAYAGHRSNSTHGGVAYLIASDGLVFNYLSGIQYGGDLRWQTPLKGLLIGASRQNQLNDGSYTFNSPGGPVPIKNSDRADWINQFYGEYTWKKLLLDSEFRRSWDGTGTPGVDESQIDVHAWYVAGAYRIVKRLQVGSYYSHYWVNFPIANLTPAGSGHSDDKVVTGRVDINRYFNIKIEGHFIDGYGYPAVSPIGFYYANNPNGLQNDTKALVVKGGFNF